MQVRINKLGKLMNEALDNENAWKRTIGCPGSRYLPEFETLHEKLLSFLKTGRKEDVNQFCDWLEENLETFA